VLVGADLIRRVLRYFPTERVLPKDALKHPFIDTKDRGEADVVTKLSLSLEQQERVLAEQQQQRPNKMQRRTLEEEEESDESEEDE
jgi:hypothetical protein